MSEENPKGKDGVNRGWDLQTSFWIDTDAYSDRDRQMFVCGVEFEMIWHLMIGGKEVLRPIHRENESRIRMLCGKYLRRCDIRQHEGYEGCEIWSDLIIYPANS